MPFFPSRSQRLNRDNTAPASCCTRSRVTFYFGRNLDYKHDSCLILKVHNPNGMSSVSVLDLHYLNLDRDDLDQTNLVQRIPLLFAPYYLQDGNESVRCSRFPICRWLGSGRRTIRRGQTSSIHRDAAHPRLRPFDR